MLINPLGKSILKASPSLAALSIQGPPGKGKPIYGVNHLASHVAVDTLENGKLPEPTLALLVSGGHSSLLKVNNINYQIESLGKTLDDAAGEAFDKVARVLGLPFPGGPWIDKAAKDSIW